MSAKNYHTNMTRVFNAPSTNPEANIKRHLQDLENQLKEKEEPEKESDSEEKEKEIPHNPEED